MVDDILKVAFRFVAEVIVDLGAASLNGKYVQVSWKSLPESRRKEILKRNRWRTAGAKLAFLAGICSAFILWEFFGFSVTDWRPIAFGFGLGVLLSVIFWDISFRHIAVNEHTLEDRAALESRNGPRWLQATLLLLSIAIFAVGCLGVARLI